MKKSNNKQIEGGLNQSCYHNKHNKEIIQKTEQSRYNSFNCLNIDQQKQKLRRDENTCKKLKYKYLDASLNNSLNKRYRSPQKNQRRQKSFNCGRKSTTQDFAFSPYRNIDYQHGLIKKNIIEEISMQNQLLNNQVTQYKMILFRMQQQLLAKDEKIVYLQQQLLKEHNMYENIIADMRQQIKAVLSKNMILQEQIKRVNDIRYHQKIITNTKNNQQFDFRQEISQLISIYQNKTNKQKPLSRSHFKSGIQTKKYLQTIFKRNNTLEQLVKSIVQMHNKIEQLPLECSDLKLLWKWLKVLGQQHNYFRKIRIPIAKKLCINPQKSIQQVIDIALVQQLKIVI